MTTKPSLTNEQRIDRKILAAQVAFETGFKSEAARKRALGELSSAYEYLYRETHNAIIDAGRAAFPEWMISGATEQYEGYCDYLNSHDLPFALSSIRPKHFELFSGHDQVILTVLVDMRKAIKNAEIILVEASENVKRAEVVRKTLREEMDARQEIYINGYDLSKILGLNVSANAHYVRHSKGTEFIRYFYYLNGNLTALNTIIAIAQKLEKDKELVCK